MFEGGVTLPGAFDAFVCSYSTSQMSLYIRLPMWIGKNHNID